jgi:hypothetical protein
VAPEHITKLRDILAVLDRSRMPDDMRLPGFRLHPIDRRAQGPVGGLGVRQLASDVPVYRW